MPEQSQPGGTRRGAGRPPSHPERGTATTRLTVRCWPDDLDYLRQLGEGSLSDGLRRCITLARSAHHAQSATSPTPASQAPAAAKLPALGIGTWTRRGQDRLHGRMNDRMHDLHDRLRWGQVATSLLHLWRGSLDEAR